MKTKKEIIEYINNTEGIGLTSSSTSYSKINKSKEVWWFNIGVDKFKDEVHLLLNTESHALWVKLPKGFVGSMQSNFKIREDKNAVDLEISADKNFKYLQDVKSGGTGFDFSGFVVKEVVY
ncbi:hypothetical protein [Flavicella sediminum]|uniref:hypothetical protein n=1 Tax=Flavicella sediminum TaxID=2585141 RepID=UPI00111FDBF2|nr:hypothetical protein [Flavicella sediminum]